MRCSYLKLVFFGVLLSACSDTAKWTIKDQNFYWSSDVFVEAVPSSANHVLLVVDDSGTMATKMGLLKNALGVLVDELSKEQLRYFVHMIRLSQVDISQVEQGKLTLPQFIPSGISQVSQDIENWNDSGLSREFGVGTLAYSIRKLFPQLADVKMVSDLMPTRFEGTMSPAQRAEINAFLQPVGSYLVPFDLPAILGLGLSDTLANLTKIAENYNYYVYPYLRDQALGQRRLNFLNAVIVSDEDDIGKNLAGGAADGTRLPLSGLPNMYVYRYERTFTQTSNLLANKMCVKKGNPLGSTGAVNGYDRYWRTGPYLRDTWSCEDSLGQNDYLTHWNMQGGVYKMCSVPNKYDCEVLQPDKNLGTKRLNLPNDVTNLFRGYITPFTNTAYCAHGDWKQISKWDTAAANYPSLKYNQICKKSPSAVNQWQVIPHDNCHPVQVMDGVSGCRAISCTSYARHAMTATVSGTTVTVTNENVCDATTEDRVNSSWAEIPGSLYDARVVTPDIDPSKVQARHHIITVRGTYVSSTYLTEDQAKLAIANDVATCPKEFTGTVNTGLCKKEEVRGQVDYYASATYVPQTIAITKKPDQPVVNTPALYTNANGLRQWVRENFPDVSLKTHSIVKHNYTPCQGETQSVDVSIGATYRALSLATGGIDRDICVVARDQNFDDFMRNLSTSVVSGNFQTIPMQGDPGEGVLEVRNLTTGTLLVKGQHYEIRTEGQYGYVALIPGEIRAGDRVRVAVIRN